MDYGRHARGQSDEGDELGQSDSECTEQQQQDGDGLGSSYCVWCQDGSQYDVYAVEDLWDGCGADGVGFRHVLGGAEWTGLVEERASGDDGG